MYFLRVHDNKGNVVESDAMFYTPEAAAKAAEELKEKLTLFGFRSPYIEVTYKEV